MEKTVKVSEDIVSQLTQEAIGLVELSNDELQNVAGGLAPPPVTRDVWVYQC